MQQSNEPRSAGARPPERQHWVHEPTDSAPIQRSEADATSNTWSPAGDAFSSSAAPIGEGSNTPVGGEPGGFQSWDARQPEPSRERFGNAGSFGLPAGAGEAAPWGVGLAATAGLGWLGYSLWQRRQSRRSRMHRLQRDFQRQLMKAALPAAMQVPKAIGKAAGNSRSPLLPFALLPLALWLRSQGGKAEKASEQLLEPLDLENRSERLAKKAARMVERKGTRLIRDNDPFEQDRGSSWWPWLLAIPILGAAYAAYRQWAKFGSLGASMDAGSSWAAGKSVRDVMSRGAEVIKPDANVAEAARKMRDLDIGSLPVCDGDRLIGVLTDRDISVRATAEGKDPNATPVRQIMSPEVTWVFEDEPADKAASIMRQRQIRRLPVLDRKDKLVGIVALGDLATDLGDDRIKGQTLEEISQPGR